MRAVQINQYGGPEVMELQEVDTRFQLEEAAQAHRYIQDRKNRGKVLILA